MENNQELNQQKNDPLIFLHHYNMNLRELPNEILYIIFMDLSLRDGLAFRLICRHFSAFELMCKPNLINETSETSAMNETSIFDIPQIKFKTRLTNDIIGSIEGIKVNRPLQLKLDILELTDDEQKEITSQLVVPIKIYTSSMVYNFALAAAGHFQLRWE